MNPIVLEDRISGTKSSRPKLNELMGLVRSKQIDVIVIWKLDRFFRSLRHLLNTVDELENLDVSLVAVKDQIDLTTPAGRLMLNMLGSFAQFERDLTAERTRLALAAAKARGVQLGRRRTFDTEAVRRLRESGMSLRGISKQMGISYGSVQAYLSLGNSEPI
jgi:DNA invertase Pin-like site-specific DNA recombinase